MAYQELTPEVLLTAGPAAPELNDRPWLVRWDLLDDAEGLVHELLPDALEFRTSGSTGRGQVWRRTRDQLWTEAGILAGLLAREAPEAILSFAPSRHVYGALATFLVPAWMRLPVWYRPQYFGAMPQRAGLRWAVVAVPWAVSALRHRAEWVGAAERLTVLHSTAMLPPTVADLVGEAGEHRISVTEVFGSTETGGVAWRTWSRDESPWRLFDDVVLAGEGATYDKDVLLRIRSPRLAARPGQPAPTVWQTDDYIRPYGGRQFSFSGRRGRLVKVNGRRVNLDDLERSLRAVLDCADLACLPVADDLSGEHLNLLVVPRHGKRLDSRRVWAAIDGAAVEVRPRRVHVVERIDRSDTGKLRRVQPPFPTDAGAFT